MKKQSIILLILSFLLLIIITGISYAYFTANSKGNETTSTVTMNAAILELTFTDGVTQISASDIVPGWSATKTFTVENTGQATAYYALKVVDITNTFTVDGSISFEITGTNGGSTVTKQVLPLVETEITPKIEIATGVTHTYTVTTYYNDLEVNQLADLGKTFAYTITIEEKNPPL